MSSKGKTHLGGGGVGSGGFNPILPPPPPKQKYNINCFWKVMKKRSNKKESIRKKDVVWVRGGGNWLLTYLRGLRFFESAWLIFWGWSLRKCWDNIGRSWEFSGGGGGRGVWHYFRESVFLLAVETFSKD